ncbi:MAG TPA: FAD-dependent oxidoreductase, partial [Actinomycetota bacterium]|nr:FAD-dependent oxidoreductase [Actinomycetota bacterium]
MVGGGVVGSATALELARRGHEVHLWERFAPGHHRGSSHGPVRIFRLTYPDPDYVALGLQALEDWRRLERDARAPLIASTGGIDFGEGVEVCVKALTQMGVPFDELDGSEVKRRWGVTAPSGPIIHVPDNGVIAAEVTVRKQIELAQRAGVDVSYLTPVTAIEGDDPVKVTTQERDVDVECLVICAGAWAAPLAQMVGIGLPLMVTCEQVAYLGPTPAIVPPVLIDWTEPARYCVPAMHGAVGLRVGIHHGGKVVDPQDGPFEPDEALTRAAVAWGAEILGVSLEPIAVETCLYTNAPNEDFILERHGGVVVVSA